ncbi:TMEM14 family protein [uncultured Gilvimarinus sp.]|uniref:TMEM14 family protein n=1 Tax=uncultured Gilvimarinus sp. TaxID=1689143 RepID=UPI0030EEA723|tara:strand:+ start:26 stop:568 length:543 start_codon:yes stop_codon:yes gene_type:complete
MTEQRKDESGASKPRSIDSEERVEQTAGEQASEDVVTSRLAEEFHNAVAIGDGVMGYLKSYSELLGLELALALKSIPALVGSWLLLLPAILLTWLSLSALVAWVGYSASGIPVIGFLVLFVMQVLLLVAMWFSVKRYRRRLTLPESRQQLKTFIQGVRNEFSEKSAAKKPETERSQESPQ